MLKFDIKMSNRFSRLFVRLTMFTAYFLTLMGMHKGSVRVKLRLHEQETGSICLHRLLSTKI